MLFCSHHLILILALVWTFSIPRFGFAFLCAIDNPKLVIYLHRKVNRMKYSFQYINIKFKIQFWKADKEKSSSDKTNNAMAEESLFRFSLSLSIWRFSFHFMTFFSMPLVFALYFYCVRNFFLLVL